MAPMKFFGGVEDPVSFVLLWLGLSIGAHAFRTSGDWALQGTVPQPVTFRERRAFSRREVKETQHEPNPEHPR